MDMDLNRQPSSGTRSAGDRAGSSGRGRGRTSAAAMKKTVTENPIQPFSLSYDTKMKILAAEMELLNDFLFQKHGVRILNVHSVYFKAVHQLTPEVDQIKRSLDASLADLELSDTRTNDERGGDDLDETLLVVKEEPNWAEQDTLIVDPGEADSDERTDSAEGNVATVSKASGLNVKPADASSAGPSLPVKNGGAKKHKCSFCSKKFAAPVRKKEHERTHTGEMPYKCQFCPRAFTVKSNKTVHERTHKGEKPFSCQFCPKAFSQNVNKIDHERSHGDDRPFSCELCGASFRQQKTKTVHMRTHTREKPFQCDECDARFGSKADKVKHMRIHTGEKPFQCEYCDKWFSQGSSLSRHLRIHTNEKPHACSVCAKSFNHSNNLRRHEKTHRK